MKLRNLAIEEFLMINIKQLLFDQNSNVCCLVILNLMTLSAESHSLINKNLNNIIKYK